MELQKNAGPEPATAAEYLDPQYWNKRFAAEEHYEWFKDYSHFHHLINPLITPSSSVLELGCGSSRLCEGLHKDGVSNITCIDLSSVAVDRMRQRLLNNGFHGIRVLEADMLHMPFQDESFDVVIEKGTMDVLFVNSGDPWNPNPETIHKVIAMLKGVHKVLKPNGTFISISFWQPHFRCPLFENPNFTWSVEWKTFGEGFHYFFYTLRKGNKTCERRECFKKSSDLPSISLMHEELDDEDFIFRTEIDGL